MQDTGMGQEGWLQPGERWDGRSTEQLGALSSSAGLGIAQGHRAGGGQQRGTGLEGTEPSSRSVPFLGEPQEKKTSRPRREEAGGISYMSRVTNGLRGAAELEVTQFSLSSCSPAPSQQEESGVRDPKGC